MLPDIRLETLRSMMKAKGVEKLLAKELAPNDNAKNQLYLSGSMEVANILPIGDVRAEITERGNKSLKAPLPFFWLQPDGGAAPAPGAQIILYPQYPEVRISGFLRGAINAPNNLLTNRHDGRLLFFGITGDQKIIAWGAGKESALAADYRALKNLEEIGVFKVIPLARAEFGVSTRKQLLKELRRVHMLNWIASKALNADKEIGPCNAPHCVGYTLEAELGIPRNSTAAPDYKGWEIKATVVPSFDSPPSAKAITLMTPEPTGGFYKQEGVAAFIRKFGYKDKSGRVDRLNFGGVFRASKRHVGTKLSLRLNGFDPDEQRVTDPLGCLQLTTDDEQIAAEWSFATLMTLWKRKHALAAYVPALKRNQPALQYRYGPTVRLGEGTDFERLLNAIAVGRVYYDPGIKLENASGRIPVVKRRSQFRVKSRDIPTLYGRMDSVSVLTGKVVE